jgi:hypothetical protein
MLLLPGAYRTPLFTILTPATGRSRGSVFWPSISRTIFRDASSSTSPKITCLPSSQGVETVVIKNLQAHSAVRGLLPRSALAAPRTRSWANGTHWEPLVFGPALAMESWPGLVCLNLKFSSANFSPESGGRLRQHLRVQLSRVDPAASQQLGIDVRTVDRLAATAVTGREIAALEHEVRDDAVERAPLHMRTQPPVNTSPALRRCTAEFLR